MFTLDQVVPWGRSLAEYRAMFGMSDDDFRGRILGCGDGPAGFNAGATAMGATVVSCDPIYQWSAPELRARIAETYGVVIGLEQVPYEFQRGANQMLRSAEGHGDDSGPEAM